MSLPLVRNWSMVNYPDEDPGVRHLQGDISGHPHLPDGKMTTSQIRGYRMIPSGEMVIVCKSRDYLLDGPPNSAWAKMFPEEASFEGLQKSLPNLNQGGNLTTNS